MNEDSIENIIKIIKERDNEIVTILNNIKNELNNDIEIYNQKIAKQGTVIRKLREELDNSKEEVQKLREELSKHKEDKTQHLRKYGNKERERSIETRTNKKDNKEAIIKGYIISYFNKGMYRNSNKIDIKSMIGTIKQIAHIEVSESDIRKVTNNPIQELQSNMDYIAWYNQSQKFSNVR